MLMFNAPCTLGLHVCEFASSSCQGQSYVIFVMFRSVNMSPGVAKHCLLSCVGFCMTKRATVYPHTHLYISLLVWF